MTRADKFRETMAAPVESLSPDMQERRLVFMETAGARAQRIADEHGVSSEPIYLAYLQGFHDALAASEGLDGRA